MFDERWAEKLFLCFIKNSKAGQSTPKAERLHIWTGFIIFDCKNPRIFHLGIEGEEFWCRWDRLCNFNFDIYEENPFIIWSSQKCIFSFCIQRMIMNSDKTHDVSRIERDFLGKTKMANHFPCLWFWVAIAIVPCELSLHNHTFLWNWLSQLLLSCGTYWNSWQSQEKTLLIY